MPLFRVERPWRAMNMDEADIDAAAFRGMACLHAFPELRWLRTYYDPKAVFSHCFYETDRPEAIREHSEAAGLPCGEIVEVLEFTPAMWTGIDPLVLKARGFSRSNALNAAD